MAKKKVESHPVKLEVALNDLEKIVSDMEGDLLSIEEAMKQFEKGIQLIRECQMILKQAEQKVSILTASPRGETHLEPYTNDNINETNQ